MNFGAANDGFHEVLAIVADAEASAERLSRAWGYSRLWAGAATDGALALLDLKPQPSREVLIGDPDQGRGFMRLLSFPGREDGVMRDGAQPWDVGGIQDINLRSLAPIEALHGACTLAGFRAFAPITQFAFGPYTVKEVVSCDADGVGLALIERIDPPLEDHEAVRGPASYIFNSTQTVPSRDVARALYVDALGWETVIEDAWTHPGEGRNCIGLPLDVARERLLKVGIYHPRGVNIGSVEVLEVVGEHLDFSAAAPPDRGLAALRLAVSDVENFLARGARGGCRIVPARSIDLPPYGPMRAGAAITPWGARLEAWQRA